MENLSNYLEERNQLGFGNYVATCDSTVQFVRQIQCINVLLVGRAQAGKSTIVQTLINPQIGTSSTGFADTREPECNTMVLTDLGTRNTFQLNIIDTPGLREMREDEENRSDDDILKLASTCVEKNITTINVVCFVSKAGLTHQLDLEVFEKVREFLGEEFSKISMLVLTHCDEYSDSALDDFEQKFRTYARSKQFFEYCKLGIARYGAVDILKIESFEADIRPGIVKSKLAKIETMRNNFLNNIILCAGKGIRIAQIHVNYIEACKEQEKLVDEAVKRRQNEETRGCSCCLIQ